MNRSLRSLICAGVSAVALGGAALAHALMMSGTALADTCVGVGNVASVNTCADLTDVVGQILTPGRPDRGPGDWTPNVYSCLGWDGRWVESNSCT
jgi:hypothetical protein